MSEIFDAYDAMLDMMEENPKMFDKEGFNFFPQPGHVSLLKKAIDRIKESPYKDEIIINGLIDSKNKMELYFEGGEALYPEIKEILDDAKYYCSVCGKMMSHPNDENKCENHRNKKLPMMNKQEFDKLESRYNKIKKRFAKSI